MEVDIHDYEKRLKQFINGLNELDEVNRDDILKFSKYLFAEGLSKGRIGKYIWILKSLVRIAGRELRNCNKEDIIEVVSKIEANENWSDSTKEECKITLRKFFKWLRN
ncbi:MAG: phage integrase SAM-like domain-containing protein, partial [Candidatus Aenigmatarchaeota archaeon]